MLEKALSLVSEAAASHTHHAKIEMVKALEEVMRAEGGHVSS